MTDYNIRLQNYLKKCELDYHVHNFEAPIEIPWLADHCDATDHICAYLRYLGYRIKKVVDDEPVPGEYMRWVETTNGLIVYADHPGYKSNGLIGRASRTK